LRAKSPVRYPAAMQSNNRGWMRTDIWMIDVQSPEALLARQLASQRTGFASAGDGPMQSDLFPILEYSAPQVFFLGNSSKVLWQFDERTWQQLLAPAEKTATLAALPLANTQLVFSDFSTINGDLFACLFGTAPNAGVPCVFQTPQTVPPPASDGSTVVNAEQFFHAGNLNQAEVLTAMALNQNPNDVQAAYLMRVIEGEVQLQKTVNTQGKAR
jgi:hypothetical protein